MTAARSPENLLDELLDLDEQARTARLEQIHAADPVLYERLRRLLDYAQKPSTIGHTVVDLAPDLLRELPLADVEDRIGATVGPFRIDAFLRRGGTGLVFRASRADGLYEQTVAIKILPTGLLSDSRRALFERERGYLARLEHPNVARIIDAGFTTDGAPYIAMEYVAGESIVNAVTGMRIRERIRLFEQLCDAVAFCHRSLVVHGDIKPDNVLVADNRVRLLDFGIGRFLGPDDESGSAAGYSPKYAAPEQRLGEAASIAADVYSLGVMLADLVGKAVRRADLYAIVDRARAVEPADRYPGVEPLLADLRAYFDGYPVSAVRSTRRYRLRKFVTRNRYGVVAGLAAFAALSAGLALAIWQAHVARAEAHRAQQLAGFVTRLFDRVDPDVAGNDDLTLRQLMDEAAGRLDNDLDQAPDVRVELREFIAAGYFGLGDYDRALEVQEQAIAELRRLVDPPDLRLVMAQNRLGTIYVYHGRQLDAIALQRDAISQLEQLGMHRSPEMAASWSRLGFALGRSRLDVKAGLEAKQRALSIYEAVLPAGDPRIGAASADVGNMLRLNGDHAAAIEFRERGLDIAARNDLLMRPSFIAARCNIALDLASLGRHSEALVNHFECLDLKQARLGPDHAEVASALNNIGNLQIYLGQVHAARETLHHADALASKTLPPGSTTRLGIEINLSLADWQSGHAERAAERLGSVVERMSQALGQTSPATARARGLLARVTLELGDTARAQALMAGSMDGLTPFWRADSTLWAAEIALASGDPATAALLAAESVDLRNRLRDFTEWQQAEAALVLAQASGDSQGARAARNILQMLPEGHIRRDLGAADRGP